jgi:hypothetical protein
MSYRVLYGSSVDATVSNQGYGDANSEQFSTEHEALNRARQLLATDQPHTVAVCDGSGNVLGGVRLQLKLGYCID